MARNFLFTFQVLTIAVFVLPDWTIVSAELRADM